MRPDARNLSRLLRPKSIAIFGGAWALNVIAQLQKSDYQGDIWPVHPKRKDMLGIPCFASIEQLPDVPDAGFIGVNREASVQVVRDLARMGAGGVTCFASGFLESDGASADSVVSGVPTGGAKLQADLVEAAGDMPLLGPNCYGFLNYLDNVTMWPDQHGGRPVERGVAIIAQSSNIAINITMQNRGLPIAYVLTAGNQSQTGISEMASQLLDDDRVSAIGFYIEGFDDLRAFETMATKAREAGKPLVALKVGQSEKARSAAISHTASIAGTAAASSAFLKRLGVAEVASIETLIDTLKLHDVFGWLPGNAISSISCSGGEASLIADLAQQTSLEFRDIGAMQAEVLAGVLGPLVTIANPLDYHTFIWGDVEKMTTVFSAVCSDQFDLNLLVLDLPRENRCDPSGFRCAVDAILATVKSTGARIAVVSTLPENLPESIADELHKAGIVTLHGMQNALMAIDAACSAKLTNNKSEQPVLLRKGADGAPLVFDEAQAKKLLSLLGLPVPKNISGVVDAQLIEQAAAELTFPVVLKKLGVAHKSDSGAVVLNIQNAEELGKALKTLRTSGVSIDAGTGAFLIEEMAKHVLLELLVGVTRDETGLLLLTIGAGGIYTELLDDKEHLLLPCSDREIRVALSKLKFAKILNGYRGRKQANIDAIVAAVAAVARYAGKDAGLRELDVNPLMVRESDVVAVDALIVSSQQE